MEIYTQSRPGRPVVATIACAGAVIGALGLALLQVHRTRGLGEERRLADTPLRVRVPRNWVAVGSSPGTFELRLAGADGRDSPLRRRIRFHYERLPAFRPVDRLASELFGVRTPAGAVRPERIGSLAAGEFRLVERQGSFAYRLLRERVVRLACTGRGDLVVVDYQPLTELTPADLELFDEVCRAVRLDDPLVAPEPQEAMRRAGVSFSPAPQWRICGPDFDPVPGLFIEGPGDGVPVWSLGVLRTWLTGERGPADLLRDFAAVYWEDVQEPPELVEYREEGRRIAAIRHPSMNTADALFPGAWVVSDDDGRAAMLLICADGDRAAAADQAAAELARGLEFADVPLGVDWAAAARDGGALARTLTARGAAPWWGRLAQRNRYVVEQVALRAEGQITREAVDGDPARGYRGSASFVVQDTNEGRAVSWTMDARGLGYTYQLESRFARRGRVDHTLIREQRRLGSERVTRVVTRGRQTGEEAFGVGPAFVCPPLESVAEFWVAQQQHGAWLIEVSTIEGPGTHTRLLVPLEPNEDGGQRVLALEDFFPRGMILTYDSDANLIEQVDPFARVRRREPGPN